MTLKKVKPYRVKKANGSGGLLAWYIVKSEIETLDEAKRVAKEYRSGHPESDGWNRIVAVVTTNDEGDDIVHYRC
ncbi:MAG: hypothetical protein GF334_00220 [Candidatus Altiarchaeales archaeon]|nr:hypothetical protein [Candidatus Altiarchaeales archaeon]